MTEEVLGSAESFVEWAEREGWLDDSVLLSARIDESRTVRLRIGLRLEAKGTTERLLEFELVGEDATLTGLPVEGGFEVAGPIEEPERFGLQLDVDGRPLKIAARAFRVIEHGERTRSVPPAFGRDLCFHGPGPLTIESLREAIAAGGARVSCYANWIGSGQLMGSAFLKDRSPRTVTAGSLSGAIRVVPEGADATDVRGLWLAGQDLRPQGYVMVETAEATDLDLLGAVVRGLGTMSGLTFAESGNQRIETAEDRERWLSTMRAR